MIPYSRQCIDDTDASMVSDALMSDWLTTGPYVDRFERALAEYTGAKHAVVVSSGTAALHAAVAAAGLGRGDLVMTSPLSFAASANCAQYVGAEAGFLDIDPTTLNLDPRKVPKCDALVAVHYAGLPVDLRRLDRRPRVIIEDAAQALGAHTPDGPVGNCAHSDMTVFSFHPVKSVTTAEGGAVTTNDGELAERMRRFRSHGMSHPVRDKPWEYEIEELGHNFRLPDVLAALGSSQMTKLDTFIHRRNELAAVYDHHLSDLPIDLPPAAPEDFRHARHLYPVRVDDRDQLYRRLRGAGIGVQVHHVPIYRLAIYGGDRSAFPETEMAYSRLLSLPLHPQLTTTEQDRVVDLLRAMLL